jgi:hypothetical protein
VHLRSALRLRNSLFHLFEGLGKNPQYACSPLQAAGWLVQLLAVVRAGCYVELHAGQYGAEVRGRDLDDIQQGPTEL